MSKLKQHLLRTTAIFLTAAIIGAVVGGVYGYIYHTAPVEIR